MKWRECVVTIFCLLGGTQALAAPGWTNHGAIEALNQQPSAYSTAPLIVFVTVSVTSNPSGCSDPTGFYFFINDDRQKRMFAMLLAAQMSERPVRIFTTGTCHAWGAAELDGLQT